MLVAIVFQLVGEATVTEAEQCLRGVFQMLSAIINITERSRNRDYQNRSLTGREAPSHQNISFGICFRDHGLQLKVKAHSVEHGLILQLSSPGFLHQADPVIPLLFETFKRLPLSKKHHTSPFKPPFSPPCCGHISVFPTTKSGP